MPNDRLRKIQGALQHGPTLQALKKAVDEFLETNPGAI